MNAHAALDLVGTERFEIVRTGHRLAEIGPAWTDLWRRVDGLAFQSHDWITAWWETAPDQSQRELRIGLGWSGNTLIAVVPLATARRKGLRMLEWAASSYCDYGDILMAPECPPAALQRLWTQLSAGGGFDIAFLNRLLPDATFRRLLAQPPTGVRLRPNHRSEASYRVTGDWTSGTAWYESQSKKTRQNYRRGRKTLEEAGRLEFRLLGPDEPMAPVLERLSALKRKWLAARDHESELFDEGAPALAALVDVLARLGILRVFVLECDGVLIAVSINFVQRDTMMAFVTTYDPDFERASPGVLLMMDYIQWSIDNGLDMVDFLCGAEPFKLRFATSSVTLDTVMGVRTPQGSLASLADRVRHTIRTARERRRVTAPAVPEELSA
ncbi:MAG TPA: GNAT family N-acetyltransferase [Devosiaceae bacterium]|jgi:CelD/BcsL family acetyltransferase involved in cellulose biosynthesis